MARVDITRKESGNVYTLTEDRRGYITIKSPTREEVFLQTQDDVSAVDEILTDEESESLAAGYPVEIRTSEPRSGILDMFFYGA